MQPPPPPADPRVPRYLGGYIFDTRAAARAGCVKAFGANGTNDGWTQLCDKAELVGHPRCDAGWCEDFEGYWMAEAAQGCGGKGFNSWSGPAGAFCCKQH